MSMGLARPRGSELVTGTIAWLASLPVLACERPTGARLQASAETDAKRDWRAGR